MVDTIPKNLSDADERKAGQKRPVSHREQPQHPTTNWVSDKLQGLKKSINTAPQRIKQTTDIIRARLSQEKKSLVRYLNGLQYKKEKFVHTVETITKNDLSSLKSSVPPRKQPVSKLSTPYITPPIAKRIAGLGEKGVQGREISYSNVADYANTVSQSNRLVRYLSE